MLKSAERQVFIDYGHLRSSPDLQTVEDANFPDADNPEVKKIELVSERVLKVSGVG